VNPTCVSRSSTIYDWHYIIIAWRSLLFFVYMNTTIRRGAKNPLRIVTAQALADRAAGVPLRVKCVEFGGSDSTPQTFRVAIMPEYSRLCQIHCIFYKVSFRLCETPP
jgi:hypothetical protein